MSVGEPSIDLMSDLFSLNDLSTNGGPELTFDDVSVAALIWETQPASTPSRRGFFDYRKTLELLIELGKPGLLALCRALPYDDCDRKNEVIEALAKHLALIEDDLCSYVSHPPDGSEAASWAIEALARARSARGIEQLLEVLADRSRYTGMRYLVARCLGESRCEQALPQLTKLASDAQEAEDVREACKAALEAMGG